MQLAEQAPERLVLLQGQVLVAEEQHQVLQQRPLQIPHDRLVVQGARQLHPAHQGSDGGGDGLHRDGLVGHGDSPPFHAGKVTTAPLRRLWGRTLPQIVRKRRLQSLRQAGVPE